MSERREMRASEKCHPGLGVGSNPDPLAPVLCAPLHIHLLDCINQAFRISELATVTGLLLFNTSKYLFSLAINTLGVRVLIGQQLSFVFYFTATYQKCSLWMWANYVWNGKAFIFFCLHYNYHLFRFLFFHCNSHFIIFPFLFFFIPICNVVCWWPCHVYEEKLFRDIFAAINLN